MRGVLLQERAVTLPSWSYDPLTDKCVHARSIIRSPKEIIMRHLKERKESQKKPSVTEKDLLDAVDVLKGAAHSDKETEDLLYALSDVCPHESVKRKAADALKR